MGKEQPSSYYDAVYAKSVNYQKHYTQSHYFNLWKRIIDICPDKPITDIGCGVGQFAEMFSDYKGQPYTGIDFSAKAIEIARAKNIKNAYFVLMDITKEMPLLNNTVLIGETLEHIKDDLSILANIKDKFLIITVPSFDDASHERFFKTTDDVTKRYSKFFPHSTIEKIGGWFLLYGQTKL